MFFSRGATNLSLVDIHSHLIPSIDDGAETLEESLVLIRELFELGYKKLIITPHINSYFPNRREDILNGVSILKDALAKESLDIELEVGAEYYIEEFFVERLLYNRDERLLSFGDRDYLLFEFPHYIPPTFNIADLIYEISLEGYTPLLAHPERYIYWHSTLHIFSKLKELGVMFQLNLNSLNGYYGTEVQKCAKWLVKNSYIDFVGSDTHQIDNIDNLKRVFSSSIYRNLFKSNKILNDSLLESSNSSFEKVAITS